MAFIEHVIDSTKDFTRVLFKQVLLLNYIIHPIEQS